MKRVAVLLCLSSFAFAQDIDVPHTLSNNSVADADQVMANLNALKDGVNTRMSVDLTTYNTAIGNGLKSVTPGTPDASSGTLNTASGIGALYSNTSGYLNTAVGLNGLYTNSAGSFNSAFGNGALYLNEDGSYNTAIGSRAAYSNTSGSYLVAVGREALFNNTSGYLNTAVGLNGLYTNSAGSFNSAFGNGALYLNEDGSYNTAMGSRAAYSNTSGSHLVAVGREALFTTTTGDFNTAIGYAADVTIGDLTNATAIGYNAKVNASNKVRIGNTNVTVIEGNVGLTVTSDARLKEDIASIENGLAFLKDLNPVKYHRINNSSDDIEMGLLAQEVEETLAAHGLSNSGMVHQASEDAYRSVRYNDLFAPMIKAIQELDVQHKKEVAMLKKRLKSQQEELLVIVQSQQDQIARLESMLERTLVAR